MKGRNRVAKIYRSEAMAILLEGWAAENPPSTVGYDL
jgi:hypothetical protein